MCKYRLCKSELPSDSITGRNFICKRNVMSLRQGSSCVNKYMWEIITNDQTRKLLAVKTG